MKTAEDIRDWLADTSNFRDDVRIRGYVMRMPYTLSTGEDISIQQSSSHYCDETSVEMWYCPHSTILSPYGDGTEPYARVPLYVVANYINEQEKSTVRNLQLVVNGRTFELAEVLTLIKTKIDSGKEEWYAPENVMVEDAFMQVLGLLGHDPDFEIREEWVKNVTLGLTTSSLAEFKRLKK